MAVKVEPPIHIEAEPSTEKSDAKADRTRYFQLIGLSLLCYFAYFIACPLSGTNNTNAELTVRWPWLDGLTRTIFPFWSITQTYGNIQYSSHISYLQAFLQSALYAITFLAASIPYIYTIRLAQKSKWLQERYVLWLLVPPLLFGLLLVFLPGQQSNDIFSYIFYVRMITEHNANPFLSIPAQFRHDPFLHYVYWRNTKSVYGPTWLLASVITDKVARWLGGDVSIYVVCYRVAALLWGIATAALVWPIISKIAPHAKRYRAVAVIAIAWNPLLLIEFAGNGHNDATMLFFTLLAVLLHLEGHKRWAVASFAVAVMAKFIVVVLLPFYLIYVFRTLEVRPLRRRYALFVGVVFLCTAVMLYLPFWAGLDTISVLINAPSNSLFTNSPAQFLSYVFHDGVGSFLHLSGSIRDGMNSIIRYGGILVFFAVYVWQLWNTRSLKQVLSAWSWVFFALLMAGTTWFWPWYISWFISVAVLCNWKKVGWIVVPFTIGGLGIYVLYGTAFHQPGQALITDVIWNSRAVLAYGYLGYVLFKHWHDRKLALEAITAHKVRKVHPDPKEMLAIALAWLQKTPLRPLIPLRLLPEPGLE